MIIIDLKNKNTTNSILQINSDSPEYVRASHLIDTSIIPPSSTITLEMKNLAALEGTQEISIRLNLSEVLDYTVKIDY